MALANPGDMSGGMNSIVKGGGVLLSFIVVVKDLGRASSGGQQCSS